jgi:LuxR family maltose regulon positive regulatory protein
VEGEDFVVSRSASEKIDPLIVITKLYRPVLHDALVPRLRLDERIGNGKKNDTVLTLVSAPPGYGKSTAVSQWADSLVDPCAWLSLDAADSDVASFLRYLIAAVRSLYPNACDELVACLADVGMPPLSIVSAMLINGLDGIASPFVLVLDDYHRVAPESAVHELVNRLLAYPPRTLHLVVITRSEPPLTLDRLRAAHRLNEIHESDLRFTDREVAALIDKGTGHPVNTGILDALQQQMEGWVAGLRLVAGSKLAIGVLHNPIARLWSGNPAVGEYLVNEVLNAQPPVLQQWMLKTAILERFCPELCTAVCSSSPGLVSSPLTGIDFVEHLQRGNLFILPLDTERQWFRYHRQMRYELRRQLRHRMSAEEVAALHLRASDWYAEIGLIDDAIAHALAGGDIERSVCLIEESRWDSDYAVPRDFLAKWLPCLPLGIKRDRPGLLMAQAWLLFAQGRRVEIPQLMDRLERICGAGDLSLLLRGELSFFRGHYWLYEVNDSGSRWFFERALDSIPPQFVIRRSIVKVHYALSLQKVGHSKTALEYLRHLTRASDPDRPQVTARLLSGLAIIPLLEADLFGVEVQTNSMQPMLSNATATPMEGWWRYFSARVAFLRNDSAEAVRLLEKIVKQEHTFYFPLTMDALAICALSLHDAGDTKGAQDTLAAMDDLSANLAHAEATVVARCWRAHIALRQGDPIHARRCLQDVDLRALPPVMLFWAATPRLVECQVLIAEGAADDLRIALVKLQQYEDENRAVNNRLKLIEVLVLKAAALWGQDSVAKAVAALREAVNLACPGGVVRPFLECGQTLVQPLRMLISRSGEVDKRFVQRLLAALGHDIQPIIQQASGFPRVLALQETQVDLMDPLTRRECDVVALLTLRLTDKEMAEQLSISPKTVNSHLKHIYQKLKVNDRYSAVIKAQSLGIVQDRRAIGRAGGRGAKIGL